MTRLIKLLTLSWTLLPSPAWATGNIEIPSRTFPVTGVSVVSGWYCLPPGLTPDQVRVTVGFDGAEPDIVAQYGFPRADTAGLCGQTDPATALNGFFSFWNYNILDAGLHTVVVRTETLTGSSTKVVEELGPVPFEVVTLGGEFRVGLPTPVVTVEDWPEQGQQVDLQWNQALQNWSIVDTNIPPPDLIGQGEQALGEGRLGDATTIFIQAMEDDPSDPRANLYSAITRIITAALDDAELMSLASRSGVVITGDSQDASGLSIDFPDEAPPGAPRTGEVMNRLRTVVLPEIVAALESLDRISNDVEIRFDLMHLPENLRSVTERFEVEIDGGDVQALKSTLQLSQSAFELGAAYNLDAGLHPVTTQTSRDLLDAEPTLFNMRSSTPLTNARNFFDQALMNASLTIDSVLIETDDQSDDILTILPEETLEAEQTRDRLNLVRQSLQGLVILPKEGKFDDPQRLDLSPFFSGNFGTLSLFIPTFDNLGCTPTSVPTRMLSGDLSGGDAGSMFRGRTADGSTKFPLGYFPDPTFGGLAADLSQHEINAILDGPKSHFADCYTFAGNMGQQIFIRAESPDLQPFVGLVGPDGQIIANSDACQGEGLNSACLPLDAVQGGLLTLPSTGTYTVEVTSDADQESDESGGCQLNLEGECDFGSYSLDVAEGTPPACITDPDCGVGQACTNGMCGPIPCFDDTDCPSADGFICDNANGICVELITPECITDLDCGVGFVCAPDGTCVEIIF